MRLGDYETTIVKGSLAHDIYFGEKHFSSKKIVERHRHRYEVNRDFSSEKSLEGLLVFTGYHEETGLKEIVEGGDVIKHFFIGCQFHPEYLSRYWKPHPLFVAFVKAMIEFKK